MFHIHIPTPVLKRESFYPLEIHMEGADNAFSCGCAWGRPGEAGRREPLERELVLNWHFGGVLHWQKYCIVVW